MKCNAIVEVTLPMLGAVPVACAEEEGHLPQTPHGGEGKIPLAKGTVTISVRFRWGGPLDGVTTGAPPVRPHGGA